MKRKNEEVPGYDEIIFKDRNKEYGAYRIRKGYNNTLGISLLGAVALAIALVVLPSLTVPRESDLPESVITVINPDYNLEKALQVETPEEKQKPAETILRNIYVAPEVVNDTTPITDRMLPTDMLNDQTTDGIPEGDPDFTGDIEPVVPVEQKPFITVEEMPEFPGGDVALLKYVADNVVYPVEALENRVEGKVFISFVVAATGKVEKIKLLRSTGTATDLSLLENEAMRVIATLPVWEPGKQGGVPVPVIYTVPVTFDIK